MKIAGDICVYTNHNVLVEIIDPAAITLLKKEKDDKELAEKDKKANIKIDGGASEKGKEVVKEGDVTPTGY